MKFVCLSFLLILARSQEQFCSVKLCGMKTGYFVQEIEKSYLFLGNSTLSAEDEEICFVIDEFEVPFCVKLTSGWAVISQILNGVIHVSFTEKSGTITSQYHFVSPILNLPVSLGRQELVLAPYGTVSWTPENIDLLLLPNGAFKREASQVLLNLVNAKEIILDPSVKTLQISLLEGGAVEPGSWFMESSLVTLLSKTEFPFQSFVNKGYVEYVLSPAEIIQHRRFSQIPSYFSQIHETPSLPSSKKINVCIWGTDKLDGQKNIWIQQMAHMDQNKFQLTYVISLNNFQSGDNETWVEGLLNGEVIRIFPNGMAMKVDEFQHVRMFRNPFEKTTIDPDNFSERPNQKEIPFSDIWDGTLNSLILYIIQRLEVANNEINEVSPKWCQNFLSQILREMSKLECDVTVYGNNRGFSSDALLIAMSRVLGIPSISELVNLFVENVPDVIVAPSHYAIEHASVLRAQRMHPSLKTIVIPPGVDLARFQRVQPLSRRSSGDLMKKGIFVVGFLARLSIEKNPGLFLQSAKHLLEKCPVCRFRIIGDGPIRSELEELTRRLEMAWAVKFLGWQSSHNLPALLSEIDVLVNPSLRAWSETFCISNIEAMAMKIPLVTFAVGGIGEYVRSPAPSDDSNLFSIGPNALILNQASPEALSAAIYLLATNRTLAQALAEAGYRTVEAQFSVSSQVKLYELLYSASVSRVQW